jgi:hypothetical protein
MRRLEDISAACFSRAEPTSPFGPAQTRGPTSTRRPGRKKSGRRTSRPGKTATAGESQAARDGRIDPSKVSSVTVACERPGAICTRYRYFGAAVWRRRILRSPQRSLVRIGGDMKRLSVRPEVGANNGPSFIPARPTCGEEMEFTSISPTCRSVIYRYK